MAWRYALRMTFSADVCIFYAQERVDDPVHEIVFFVSQVAAEMARDIYEKREKIRGEPRFEIVKLFQHLPEYTGQLDGSGRPLNPKFWNDEQIAASKRCELQTRAFHGERCEYRKRVNGRTKVDH